MYIKKDSKLVYTKLGENKNSVQLSSIYPNNCSAEEYVIVSDEVLESLLKSNKHISNLARYARDNEAAMPYDDAIGVNVLTFEEQYSFEREEQVRQRNIHREELSAVFAQLTDKQRARLYLRFKYKMKYCDIAKLEGTTSEAIRYSCKTALKKLEKHGEILLKREARLWIDLLKPTNLEKILKKGSK